MNTILSKLQQREDLSFDEAYATMLRIMTGEYIDPEIAGFLIGMSMKGETTDEIAGFATAMREKMVKIPITVDAIDMCGTGGDGTGTFNISTAASFVVAGAGIPVAKHGNRSISSKSGSADVLTELGVDIRMDPEKTARCVDDIGLGFLFAPALHPAMKHVMPARKALAVRTVFNILGPLCNPAEVKRQLIGLFDGKLTEKLAQVLKQLGTKSAMTVHGADGLDEISTTGVTRMSILSESGEVESIEFDPKSVGYNSNSLQDILGGSATDNAKIIRSILEGQSGPHRDITILNAAAGLVVGGKAANIEEGLEYSKEAIDSGKAEKVLERLASA